MKCTVSSKEFKAALKSINAVLSYGGNATDDPCCLTVTEAGLTIETARNGASIERTLPCKVLREGVAGVSAAALTEMKLTGDVTLELEKGKFTAKAGKAKYEITLHGMAAELIAEQRVDVTEVASKARLPTSMIKSAAKCCIYKSDVKADFDCQVVISAGLFEFAGMDNVSFGRFRAEHETIKARSKLEFVLPTELFSKLADEIDGATCEIHSVPKRGVVVFIGTGYRIVHPVIEKEVMDIQERLDEVVGLECNAKLEVLHDDIRDGLDTVAAAAKLRNTVVLGIKTGKAILMAQNDGTDARHVLAPVAVEVQGEVKMTAKHSYLAEIVKVAPASANLELALYENKFLHVHVKAEPSRIDYLVAQLF
jgi:DNA polymerase III sliding clamp (beta) subunit (PCNA family)